MKGKPDRSGLELREDIPELQRDTIGPSPQPTKPFPWQSLVVAGVLAVGAGAIAVGFWALRPVPNRQANGNDSNGGSVSVEQTPEPNTGEVGSGNEPARVDPNPVEPQVTPEDILGHYPYEVANTDRLKAVTSDGRVRLQEEAAEQFLAMQGAARSQGIALVALSGYRTFDEQKYLFFQIKQNRGQDARERAKVSAPPGYSEHHTGFAIDIGDGNASSTHIQESFETTRAFAWLERNATRYGFELSFPRDNEQGISYEPWHWRYVGNPESLETFYKGR